MADESIDLKRISALSTEATRSDWLANTFFAVDNASIGTKKLAASILVTILNNFAKEFKSDVACVAGKCYWKDGVLYKCKNAHSGTWSDNDFEEATIDDIKQTVAHLLGVTATDADFTATNFIAISSASEQKKMPLNLLAKASEQTALTTYAQNVAASIAPPFEERTSENPYKTGKHVTYIDGKVYEFINDHYGPWDTEDVKYSPLNYLLDYIQTKLSEFDVAEEILIVDSNDNVLVQIKDGVVSIKSMKLYDGNGYVLIHPGSEEGDRKVTMDGPIVITDDNDNYVASIDNDGIHGKGFSIRTSEDGEDTPVGSESVEFSLPSKFVAVVGDTLQIFFRGIMKAPNPYVWDLNGECVIGKNTPRFFEVTPVVANVGTKTLNFYAKNGQNNIVGQASTSLQVVAQPTSPQTEKKILCFGASNTRDGKWCIEAARRLTGSGGSPVGLGLTNIEFCGGMNNGAGVGWFGVGGWNWSNYVTSGGRAIRFQVTGVSSAGYNAVYSNDGHEYKVIENNTTGGTGNILCSVADGSSFVPDSTMTLTKVSGVGDETITYTSYSEDVQNPLWDSTNNKMSFVPYANTYSDGDVDVVYTLLTWNGLTAYQSDFSTILAQVKTFADTLHAEFPNAKLRILGQNGPSVNGGVGANYGASGQYYDWYGLHVSIMNQNKAYKEFAEDDDYSSFVEFVCTTGQFDAEYNMQTTAAPVNTRNSATETRGTNGVHPSNDGYMQIADSVYRDMCLLLQ